MAELILTDEEKAAALWSDLGDAALGKLIKRKIALITECSDQLDRITTVAAAMMLCLEARRSGANKAVFDIDGLTDGCVPVGNWRITVEQLPDAATPVPR